MHQYTNSSMYVITNISIIHFLKNFYVWGIQIFKEDTKLYNFSFLITPKSEHKHTFENLAIQKILL